MKSLFIIILLLSCNFAASQNQNSENDEKKEQIRADFAFYVGPTRWGFREAYSLGIEQQINKRFSLGLNYNTSYFEAKVYSSEVWRRLDLTFGPSLKTLLNKKIYLDPYLHVAYERIFISQQEIKYRGFGFQLGLRTGYSFKRFSIGIKAY